MKKRKDNTRLGKKTKHGSRRNKKNHVKKSSKKSKRKDLPTFNILNSLIDEIDQILRSYLENLDYDDKMENKLLEDDLGDVDDIDDIDDIEIILSHAKIVLMKTLWLTYPNRYYKYIRTIKNANRISNIVYALISLIKDGENNFSLGFIDLGSLEISSELIKRYNSIKFAMNKYIKNDKVTQHQLTILSDTIIEIREDFTDFWNHGKNHVELPEHVIENHDLENSINILWYFNLICQFLHLIIPDYQSIEEDRKVMIGALYSLLEVIDDEELELEERMLEEIDGTGLEFWIDGEEEEEEEEDFENIDSEYNQEFEHLETHLEHDMDQEAEIILIKSNPEQFFCFFVIVTSGIESILTISVFIHSLRERENEDNIDPLQPFDAYQISWIEFTKSFMEEERGWQSYSKSQLTKAMKHASEHMTINGMEYITDRIDELGVSKMSFSTTKRVLVDFDEHGVKPTSQFSKNFRLELGEILKDRLVNKIAELGYETEYVDMNEEEYLEENEFSDFGSSFR